VRLRDNRAITNDGIRLISKHATQAITLDVAGCDVTPNCLKWLKNMPKLQSLKLPDTRSKQDQVRTMARLPQVSVDYAVDMKEDLENYPGRNWESDTRSSTP
jgi:hypothetical protein